MRDRTVAALFFVGIALAIGWGLFLTGDLPAEDAPNTEFEVTTDPAAGELVVEHVGGEALESGSVRVLVYEDRPIIPDRTVHGTVWETETGVVGPTDRIELEDPRFESGQRVVIRWFGDAGQANLQESRFE